MDKTMQTFKALSDKNRIRILKLLESRPLCVCEITDILGIAQSSTSEHLKILKEAALIKDKKDSYWVNYHLTKRTENNFIREQLKVLARSFNDDPVIMEDRRKAQKVDRRSLCCE